MQKKVVMCLLILTAGVMSSFIACAKKTPISEMGEPKYGGTINCHVAGFMPGGLDPFSSWGGFLSYYMETLWIPSWTADRNKWPFQTSFTPPEYYAGCLAESWEMTDPQTLTVNLRKGVKWQKKPPVNGRELTADDIVYHYNRVMGAGSGFTQPSPFHAARFALLEKVTATGKYVIQFKFKFPTAIGFLSLCEVSGQNFIEAPEWVALGGPPGSGILGGAPAKGKGGPPKGGPPKGGPPEGGPTTDWKNAVGTGPWIMTDFVDGSSVTFAKNPDYWGFDERNPKNRLPYADTFKLVVIPDIATSLAALRTGKIDIMGGVAWQQAQSLAKTNPDLKQASYPVAGQTACMRPDKSPFTDIRVRKAMQLAIDIEKIAQTRYGGVVEGKPCGLINPAISRAGYGFDYEDWPRKLKDEYTYNPEEAKQLLAQAGYPKGFKTSLVAGSNGDTELMQIMKSQLKDIGVDMDIRLMGFIAAMTFMQAGKTEQMAWDTIGKTGTTINVGIAIANFHSKDMANFGKVNDPKYDELVDQFNHATTMDKAKELLKQADQYALEQHWTIAVCPILNYCIWQPYLKGYMGEAAFGAGGFNGGWIWARLWIDKEAE